MKHLLNLKSLTAHEIQSILDLSAELNETNEKVLVDKHILFVFEKPSLRTVLGTEVAINQLGGHVIHTQPEIMLSKGKNVEYSCREALQDTIMNVAQWCDAIFARVFSHDTLSNMAAMSSIPVVNALCEKYHPMQALADILTIQQTFSKYEKPTLTFVGDANNVAYSLFEGLLKLGYAVRFTGPKKYYWNDSQIAYFEHLASKNGTEFIHSVNPEKVLPGSDIVYTDTFVSMGEELVAAEKIAHFHGYQVNEQLMSLTGKSSAFMHCQPAHRGVEVTNEVMDGTNSLIKQQAYNRMVTSKGVFASLISNQIYHQPAETAVSIEL